METEGSVYGTCACGGAIEAGFIDVYFHGSDPPDGLHDVPQGRCVECGARVYKAAVLERVEAVHAEIRAADSG